MRFCVRYIATAKSAPSRKPRRWRSARALVKDVNRRRPLQFQRKEAGVRRYVGNHTHQICESLATGKFDLLRNSWALLPTETDQSAPSMRPVEFGHRGLYLPSIIPSVAPAILKIWRYLLRFWGVKGGSSVIAGVSSGMAKRGRGPARRR